jgi:hypothetical protein
MNMPCHIKHKAVYKVSQNKTPTFGKVRSLLLKLK